jgi:hypothetical protein
MANCEENSRLFRMLTDAWEHYDRLKDRLAVSDDEHRESLEDDLKNAFWVATRLSDKRKAHIATCLICCTLPNLLQ